MTSTATAEDLLPTKRVFVTFAFFMLGLITMSGRLYQIQVMQHSYWLGRMRTGSEVSVRIPSIRGEIRDRNGIALAENHASYAIEFYLPDLLRAYRANNGNKVPMYEYVTTSKKGMKRTQREPDIVQVVNQIAIPRLEELGLAEDYNSEKIRAQFRNNREVPFIYRDGLSFETVAKYTEANLGLPGVEITKRPERLYPLRALGAHFLGYIGAVHNIADQEDVGQFTFYEPDPEGKSQIEQFCNKWLRGRPGARLLHRSPKGIIEHEVRRVEARTGDNVLLTIDARLQYIVERALREAGVGRAAAVVVDPGSGDILAMASIPSYDPNVFIPSIAADDWKKLTSDTTDPLTNRAVQSYAPGSIYKVVTALAELRAGIPPARTFSCSGGVQYGNKYMKCWIAGRGSHGPLTLPDAIKNSCNAYFYQAGNAAGIEQIVAVGEALGLGKKTNIPISGESSGVLPGPKWLNHTNPGERWSDGHTANVSIGQGYVLTSPLQMAMVAATIANRGTAYEPHLIHRVVDENGEDAREPKIGHKHVDPTPKIHADLGRAGISRQQIEAVREGMRLVVAGGTGKRGQINGVEVAGKTGTAQFWRGTVQDNHTWFIAFAPYDTPRFALCVLVQGAKSGGGVAAPIAREILEQALALDHGYNPKPVAMEPAAGSFEQVMAVDYKRAPRALPSSANEPIAAKAVAVNPDGSSATPAVPRAVPVESAPAIAAAATTEEETDADPENSDFVDEAFPKAIPRAIPVNTPMQFHKPEIRPKADVIIELNPRT